MTSPDAPRPLTDLSSRWLAIQSMPSWAAVEALVDDLFATLDAARSASPDPARLRAALSQPEPLDAWTGDPLADVIEDVLDSHAQEVSTCSCGQWTPYGPAGTTFRWHVARVLAARLSSPTDE